MSKLRTEAVSLISVFSLTPITQLPYNRNSITFSVRMKNEWIGEQTQNEGVTEKGGIDSMLGIRRDFIQMLTGIQR